ncbi:MAG TPA: UpxY family transcription antiterminator [Puia sp.]|uniref:UpxY family transcription antiterminator n=1 Tax=Puia sp. TaxID=2045100 RepID=UPI002BACCD25|nr:UpxY family transcription antiterminator [Puia sp.]HVU94496.1 UpxY family transcription antiterminator [Puia sp.]
MTLLPPPSWHVIYTMPRVEKTVTETIRHLSLETYLPLRLVSRKWTDRIKTVQAPLFNGYVFVRVSKHERFSLLKIPGVLRFVTFDKQPAILSEEEILRIRNFETNGKEIQPETFLQPGDKVRVVKGIFQDIEGFLIKKLNKTRLMIRMPLLRQSISVEMPEDYLARIE